MRKSRPYFKKQVSHFNKPGITLKKLYHFNLTFSSLSTGLYKLSGFTSFLKRIKWKLLIYLSIKTCQGSLHPWTSFLNLSIYQSFTVSETRRMIQILALITFGTKFDYCNNLDKLKSRELASVWNMPLTPLTLLFSLTGPKIPAS